MDYTQWDCPDCDFVGYPRVMEVKENTDRDGNRGKSVHYVVCPECEHEEAI